MARKNNKYEGELFMDDLEDSCDIPSNKVVVKRCPCGYRGELEADANGWSCPDCGHLLVESW